MFIIRTVVILFFAAAFFFPLANDIRPTIGEPAPQGIPQIENRLKFSWGAFHKKIYQKKATELAKKRSGYWTPLTLFGNQILFTLYDQISAFHNNSIFMGDDNQVLQTIHVNHFNRRPDPSVYSEKVTNRLNSLKKLQQLQAKRGKSVIALISPNVLELYPETVPSRYIDPTRNERESSYEQVKRRMDEMGILYIDSPAILETAKDKYDFRFWARTGSHWNDVGSCIVLKELNDKLIANKLTSFPEFDCDNWKMEFPPRNKDLDLFKLANVLFPYRYFEPAPYIDPSSDPDRSEIEKPKVVMSGSSYLFAFAEAFKKRQLSDAYVHYFYYRQRRAQGMRGFNKLIKQHIPWDEILDRDIIIVDAPMRQASSMGYGFVEDATKKLKKMLRQDHEPDNDDEIKAPKKPSKKKRKKKR